MKKLFYTLLFLILFTSCNLSKTNYVIASVAMLPSLTVGSHLKITKQIEQLDYGDIIVYNYDGKITEYYEIHGHFIYRVVGLPGDSIAIDNNICIINGKKNNSQFIQTGTSNKDIDETDRLYIEEYEELFPNGIAIHIFRYSSKYTYSHYFEENKRNMKTIKVPENHYFLMGDFRSNVVDSRYIGTAPKEQIIGKVIKITPKKK